MSPRGPPSSSTRSAASPYPRRPSGQPKSSRQQFSACGACRMRRVRCDLKDLSIDQAGPDPSCSNCRERGLKCVDEFADVKAVKLLRRGRRLQQVERIYGKVTDPDHGEGSSSLGSQSRQRIIPALQPEFFTSPFWQWFSTQRPIFDSNEFPARFFAHTKGSQILSPEGQILAMLLVVWAYSYGINERGAEESSTFEFPLSSIPDFDATSSSSPRNTRRATVNIPTDRERSQCLKGGFDQQRNERREHTDLMLREVLEFIDLHSVMRHPTWDGVRILLLILPLMEEYHHLDRLMMYEAALAQSHALWSLPSSSGPSPFSHVPDDALVRMRVYCYAHLQEGIAGGLRGGRLTLDSDDLAALQQSLQSSGYTDRGSPSFATPTDSFPLPLSPSHQRRSTSSPFWNSNDVFSLPLRLSSVCRKVHTVLTGAKAVRRQDAGTELDAAGMKDIWDGLSKCWDEFEAVRPSISSNLAEDGIDLDRFASAWQIFIFECHNIIRETLKQRLSKASSPPMYSSNSPQPGSEHSSSTASYSSIQGLHGIALHHCARLLPSVISLIRHHLDRASRDPEGVALFKWDTGLVKDGVFFAGILAAGGETDLPTYSDDRSFKQEDIDGLPTNVEEDNVRLCIRALSEMRWAYAKSEDRIDSIKLIWENRRRNTRITPGSEYATSHHDQSPLRYLQDQQAQRHCPIPSYGYPKTMGHTNSHAGLPLSSINDRSTRPPLSINLSSRTYAESAPNTACSTDGSASLGWPSYSPPGTGTSATTSTSTGFSGDSPVFTTRLPTNNGMQSYKTDGLTTEEGFYTVSTTDVDSQFTYNAPMNGGPIGNGAGSLVDASLSAAYTHRPSSHHSQHGMINTNASHAYIDSVAYMPTAATHALSHVEDMAAVAQFATTDFY